jgi:putative endonuclease
MAAGLGSDVASTPEWRVYLLECADGSYYVGCTSDVDRRLAEHEAGRGARYTRGRGPLALIGSIACESRSDAQKLEARLKRLTRADKVRIVLERGQT